MKNQHPEWQQLELFETSECRDATDSLVYAVAQSAYPVKPNMDLEQRIANLEAEVEDLHGMIGRLYEAACAESEAKMVRAFNEGAV